MWHGRRRQRSFEKRACGADLSVLQPWLQDEVRRGARAVRGTGTATLAFHPANAVSAEPAVTTTVTLSQPVTFLPDLLSAQLGLTKALGMGSGPGMGM